MSRNLLFAMTGAYGITGGIASVNRNMLVALAELAEESRSRMQVIGYLESDADRPPRLAQWIEFHGLGGNRAELASRLWVAALRGATIVVDHVSLAWPIVPLAMTRLVKSVIYAHGSESWRRVRTLSKWAFRSSTLTLTNSEYTLRRMRARVGRFNGYACPLGLSPDALCNASLTSDQQPSMALESAAGETQSLGPSMLLLVGRMHPRERQKGHDALIGIMPRLRERFPDAQLVCAGPGDDRARLARLARDGGVGQAVFLPGYMPADQLAALYRQCYAFVMPSRQEGFGMVYLEAMNCGKPCVGSFDDGAEDVIVHGETGFLLRDRDDESELLSVLSRLLADPAQARRMGRNGFERLHRHFTAAHAQERIKTHIRSIL